MSRESMASPSDTEPIGTPLVLREMYGEWHCPTELCSGPSFGLVVKRGVVWAVSECPCGSMNQSYPIPMSDLLILTEMALDALFGKCDNCGEPCRVIYGAERSDAEASSASTTEAGYEGPRCRVCPSGHTGPRHDPSSVGDETP